MEQIIRPTGIPDPEVEVRPSKNQIDDLLEEIRKRTQQRERTLVTTLTKRMAEDLSDYLASYGVAVRYMHSDIDALERVEILRDLRLGAFDVLVGVKPAPGGARSARSFRSWPSSTRTRRASCEASAP